jgi:hypothetical protein
MIMTLVSQKFLLPTTEDMMEKSKIGKDVVRVYEPSSMRYFEIFIAEQGVRESCHDGSTSLLPVKTASGKFFILVCTDIGMTIFTSPDRLINVRILNSSRMPTVRMTNSTYVITTFNARNEPHHDELLVPHEDEADNDLASLNKSSTSFLHAS